MPIGDGAEVGGGAEAEGGAVGDDAEHGHLDARIWRVVELCRLGQLGSSSQPIQ